MIEASWIAGLGVILFSIGLLGAFTRKNAIVVLMCIEVMLNAANLNFVAGASHDTILEETPVENVLAMFDAIHEFGVYGVQ